MPEPKISKNFQSRMCDLTWKGSKPEAFICSPSLSGIGPAKVSKCSQICLQTKSLFKSGPFLQPWYPFNLFRPSFPSRECDISTLRMSAAEWIRPVGCFRFPRIGNIFWASQHFVFSKKKWLFIFYTDTKSFYLWCILGSLINKKSRSESLSFLFSIQRNILLQFSKFIISYYQS